MSIFLKNMMMIFLLVLVLGVTLILEINQNYLKNGVLKKGSLK